MTLSDYVGTAELNELDLELFDDVTTAGVRDEVSKRLRQYCKLDDRSLLVSLCRG